MATAKNMYWAVTAALILAASTNRPGWADSEAQLQAGSEAQMHASSQAQLQAGSQAQMHARSQAQLHARSVAQSQANSESTWGNGRKWGAPAGAVKQSGNMSETRLLYKNDSLVPTQNRTQAMRLEAETGRINPQVDAALKPYLHKKQPPIRHHLR
jgi:hypothetical protein